MRPVNVTFFLLSLFYMAHDSLAVVMLQYLEGNGFRKIPPYH